MEKQSAKIIKASRSLQMKAGKGVIAHESVQRAEDVIKNNDEDFSSIANGFLIRLHDAVEMAERNTAISKSDLIAGMIKPVMELKANAKMFKYNLVTSLANIMLEFLETIEHLDNKAVEIVAAHHKTLSMIITRKMSGDGGQVGAALQRELQSVCQRYFAQKSN